MENARGPIGRTCTIFARAARRRDVARCVCKCATRKGEKWLQEREWKQGIHMPRTSWLDKDRVPGGQVKLNVCGAPHGVPEKELESVA